MAEDTKERGISLEVGARDERGRWLTNANPTGNRFPAHLADILKAATPHAACRLVEALDAEMVVHHEGVVVGTYVDHQMRVRAAEAIFTRLYGKPLQRVEGPDGQPLTVTVDLSALLLRLAGG